MSHEHDDFYLTTPYKPRDWSSPNGDPSYNGKPGMNCGGFVGYVVKQAGMDLAAFDKAVKKSAYWFSWIRHSSNSWYIYVTTYHVYSYQFASKEELLASGLAQKGDIILTWYGYNTWGNHDNHVGFFWGDRPDEDLMWHSSLAYGENAITPLTAASPKSVWYLIPLSETKEPEETTESEETTGSDIEPEETETSEDNSSSTEEQPPETSTDDGFTESTDAEGDLTMTDMSNDTDVEEPPQTSAETV